jgi:hypothetical protein
VAILRWQEMVGVQAVLEATGESFDEVRSYRVVEDEFEELAEPDNEEDAA